MDKYIDKYGLVHPQENEASENGILFRAILDNWCHITNHVFYDGWQKAIANTIINKNRFQANPPENGDHFSRDNMLGLYAMLKIHGMKKTMKQLPLMVWNNHKWYDPRNWHPNTWAVFIAFKYPIMKYNPLLLIMGLFSLLATDYKNTSGKNLWFLTFAALEIEWPLKLAQKRYEKKSIQVLKNLFDFSHTWYFSNGYNYVNRDNPIRERVLVYYLQPRKF